MNRNDYTGLDIHFISFIFNILAGLLRRKVACDSGNTWLKAKIDLVASASSWHVAIGLFRNCASLSSVHGFVHFGPGLPMKGKLQTDPEEVWIFGFGSIIYKQGS